ncbi:MAG: LytTR family transcriptional regulator DNA-binding domain-containing protein [Bacteroidaceae bacterium]
MTDKLLFRIYGEMYLVDLPQVLYFKADDHYTHVYTNSGTHMVMPFGLNKVEAAIAQRMPEDNFLIRLGRTYIVNIKRIYHINMLKQSVLLADEHGQVHSLHFSRQVLQSLMEHLERKCHKAPPSNA